MSTENKSGAKTLLMSIIMSSPGPLVVGLALFAGRSSTQIADFVRRTVEFLAIVMSFLVFTSTQKCDDEVKKRRLERTSNVFVGSTMFIAGAIMMVLAFYIKDSNRGSVIPALAIALFGGIANSVFWLKYTRLSKTHPSPIFNVQSKLYRAKTLIDASVTVALTSILISPASKLAHWLDIAGSLVVAIYLAWSGLKVVVVEILEARQNKVTEKNE